MGVDSGLPDFRGNEGFWNAYPPIRQLGLSFSEMANPEWFETNPKLAWGFYGHRLHLYRDTEPHRGFSLLRKLGESKPEGYFVFTSNVDGQFQKAGFDEKNIYECHGSIHHFQCFENCQERIWSAESYDTPVNVEKLEALELPQCLNCGAIARPNILMFGDWGFNSRRVANQQAQLESWLDHLRRSHATLLIIEVGAGKAVPTVRMASEQIARQMDATFIRINPRDRDVPAGQFPIPFGGLEGISKLLESS